MALAIGIWTKKQDDDITDGGNANLGWWELNANTDFTVNVLSGSKFVSKNLEFANAGATNTAYGRITWNQSGSEDAISESVFSGDVNLRLSKAASVDNGNFETTISLQGYSKFISRSNLNIGSTDSQSGTANFLISGTNNYAEFNSVYVRAGSDTDDVATKVNIEISGSNNTLYAQNNFNLSETVLKNGTTIDFTMIGEGNVLNVNNFNVSNQDESTGSTVTALFKGDSATNKNQIIIRSGEFVLQGSQALDATTSYTFSMQGNTTLNRGDGRGVWLKLHEWGGKHYTTNTTFEVMGSGNDILLSGLEIGKETDNWEDGAGKGIFRIVGGGSSIVIKNNEDGHNGLRLNSGGMIEFVIDDTGITPITNFTWNNNTSNGMMTIDFSNITAAQDEARYVLIQTNDGNTALWGDLFDISNRDDLLGYEEYVSVILANPDDDTYRFALEVVESDEFQDDNGNNVTFNQLVVYYTNNVVVPEPSTYAAIFGALALAFVAYRRRK